MRCIFENCRGLIQKNDAYIECVGCGDIACINCSILIPHCGHCDDCMEEVPSDRCLNCASMKTIFFFSCLGFIYSFYFLFQCLRMKTLQTRWRRSTIVGTDQWPHSRFSPLHNVRDVCWWSRRGGGCCCRCGVCKAHCCIRPLPHSWCSTSVIEPQWGSLMLIESQQQQLWGSHSWRHSHMWDFSFTIKIILSNDSSARIYFWVL